MCRTAYGVDIVRKEESTKKQKSKDQEAKRGVLKATGKAQCRMDQ